MPAFALAVFFLLVTPGPGVLSTAGVGAGFGYRAGLRYVAGLFVGTNLVALAVVSGLAAVLLAHAPLRAVLLAASAAYLLYLAAKIGFAGAKVAFKAAERAPGFMSGVALQAINPKAYAVNTALFTGFAFWPTSLAVETALKFLILNAIWVPIHLAWLAAGAALRRLDLPDGVQRAINLTMAALLVGVVVLALVSLL